MVYVRLHYFHNLESSDNSIFSEGEEITEFSEPWKTKSKFDPPKTDNEDLGLFLDAMKKELLIPKKENRVQDNLKITEREVLYRLANYNEDIKSKNLIRTQDKGSRLVIECKERYMKEMFSHLSNEETFRDDESDQSKMYQQKINNWTKLWEYNLPKEEIGRINKIEIKSAKIYANVKRHKENNPYQFIVSAKRTAI